MASHLPLFDLDPSAQREWLAERLSRPSPPTARGLSDGFRLPGRDGLVTPAAVLVGIAHRWGVWTWILALLGSIVPLGSVIFVMWADRTGRMSPVAGTKTTSVPQST